MLRRSSLKYQVQILSRGESRYYRRTYDRVHTEFSFASSLGTKMHLHPKILTGLCAHNISCRGEASRYGRIRATRSDKIGAQGGANERNLFARDTVGSVALCSRSPAPVRAPVHKKYFSPYFRGWRYIVAYNSLLN